MHPAFDLIISDASSNVVVGGAWADSTIIGRSDKCTLRHVVELHPDWPSVVGGCTRSRDKGPPYVKLSITDGEVRVTGISNSDTCSSCTNKESTARAHDCDAVVWYECSPIEDSVDRW